MSKIDTNGVLRAHVTAALVAALEALYPDRVPRSPLDAFQHGRLVGAIDVVDVFRNALRQVEREKAAAGPSLS